jgi:hypothetical protein
VIFSALVLIFPFIAGFSAMLAVAAPPPPGYVGGGRHGAALTLAYTASAGFADVVKLDCDPVGGGHPSGAAACATLDAADGDPERITPARTMCMTIYMPVDAEMTGTWHGRHVEWKHRYGNTCEMRRATGVLFAF